MKVSFLIGLIFIFDQLSAQKTIKNYVFFGMDRARIREASFLKHEGFVGAQLKYSWRELEPQKDQYDFSEIRKNLNFLTSQGKKLFIQLQDVTFDTVRIFVPKYIMQDSIYGGGADIQYLTDHKENIILQDGYMARRWDANVAERFHKLIIALAQEFDGKIQGLNFSETAVGFGDSGKLYPEGFSPMVYRDAIIKQMEVAKKLLQNQWCCNTPISCRENGYPGMIMVIWRVFINLLQRMMWPWVDQTSKYIKKLK